MIPVGATVRGSSKAPRGPLVIRVVAAVVTLVVATFLSPSITAARAAPVSPVSPDTMTDQALTDSVHQIEVAEAVRPIDVDKAVVALRTERHDGSGVAVTISSDVLFAFDSADLTAIARGQLSDLAAQISHTTATVGVNGYTDSTGTPAYNVILSQRRANAVADLLRPSAPHDVLVSATGHGSANPVASDTSPDGSDNPAGRAQNRRVTITYRTP